MANTEDRLIGLNRDTGAYFKIIGEEPEYFDYTSDLLDDALKIINPQGVHD